MNNREKCIKMWTWLAETGKQKDDYFEKFELPYVTCGCYACEGAKDSLCENCPVDWDGKGGECCMGDSPFDEWCYCEKESKRKLAAAKVLKVIKETWKP